ncbi:hypothetical protein [Tamlana sp. I1]|uniref:hypothetical protein n=1 Tax=Tamlana sp. I1 TaxID=2762061 RepID=UPI00188EDA53|nr:hypothetical protein [Tamlana sp. I1]
MKFPLLACFVLVLLFNCSSSDDSSSGSSISNQNLTGTVEGESFTFVAGKAFETSFNNEDLYSVNLTNEVVGCEDYVLDYGLKISATVPKSVGVYNDINIVTQNGNNTPVNNLNRTVEITAVSDTEISGKMKLNKEESPVSEESIFEGAFTVAICD